MRINPEILLFSYKVDCPLAYHFGDQIQARNSRQDVSERIKVSAKFNPFYILSTEMSLLSLHLHRPPLFSSALLHLLKPPLLFFACRMFANHEVLHVFPIHLIFVVVSIYVWQIYQELCVFVFDGNYSKRKIGKVKM